MKKQILTIDFDNFGSRINDARQCILDFLPCDVRMSSSRNGIHLKKICYNEIELSNALRVKKKWDDPQRLNLDDQRAGTKLSPEILFKRKCIGQDIKEAGKWIHFNRIKDATNMEVLLCH